MLKKWKKTIKVFATTILVLVYVTIGFFNGETLKGDEKKKRTLTYLYDSPGTTEKYPGTVKTILGYSEEFRIRKELKERIDCEGRSFPEENQAQGWTEDEKLGIRIFSAYYDQRHELYHYVRVIGLLRKKSSFYCQIWYKNNATIIFVTQKASVSRIWLDEWGPKNTTCQNEHPVIISCLAPSQNGTGLPSWVSFVDKSCTGGRAFVKIVPPTPTKAINNFTICVKPLTLGHVNKRSFLEWLDINRRLGAEKITIYIPDSTKTDLISRKRGLIVKKFFDSQDQLDSCPSRNLEESIWHKRKMEIIAYNDCFYSNLYHTKFVIPLDVDEIIVPKSGNNWFEAFRSHFVNGKLSKGTKNAWPEDVENYASFSVRNAYFFPQYPKDAIIRSLTLPKRDQKSQEKLVKAFLQRRTPKVNIFDRTVRSYRLSPNVDSVKSFIHVGKTLSVFNHFAFHVLGEARRQFIFPEDVFQLNHYRNSCDPVLIDGCGDFLNEVVYDDSLERFRKKRKLPPEGGS